MTDPALTNRLPPLTRIREGAMIAGVCGGIARWLGWDPSLVRILYVLLSIASNGFPGILVYLLLWLILRASERAPLYSCESPGSVHPVYGHRR
jgi:phage shock protein PspC (stress-responsive transcriptional regulator)